VYEDPRTRQLHFYPEELAKHLGLRYTPKVERELCDAFTRAARDSFGKDLKETFVREPADAAARRN